MYFASRAIPALRTSGATFAQPRTQARRYATAPSSGPSNWPMALALAGVAGLGGYVYLQRNPSLKSEISAEILEAEAKAKAIAAAAQAKAHDLKEKVEAKGKGLIAEKDASNEGVGVMGALIKDSWTSFLLTKVEPYNHNTKIYTFEFPGDDGKSKISGGQVASALLVKSEPGENEVKDDKGKPVIRPYTPISPPDQTGSLTLMIKEYKDGKITSHIAKMTPGKDSLQFKGPIQKYLYKPNEFDRGLCISGGSGITPMYQLISHSLGLSEDKTKWTLVFSNVTEKDILLRKEWDSLAKQYPDRLEVKYVLDKAPWGWKGETGYITAPLISKVFPRKADEKVMAFVCGPPPQVKSVAGDKDGPRQGELKGALAELGYKAEEVFKF